MENQMITIQPIPKETVTEAMDLLKESFVKMSPYLVALTPADRKSILKMNNGTEPFASQGINYISNNPELVPNYVDVETLRNSYATFEDLSPMLAFLAEYCSQVSDTKMVAGSTTFTWVLAFYDSIKTAANKRVPGAKTIYEELKKRFAKKKKKVEKAAGTIKPNANMDAVA